MITYISNKSKREHKLDIEILNRENIKNGDSLYLSQDDRNLDTISHNKIAQILGVYEHPNRVYGDLDFVSGAEEVYSDYKVYFKE